MNKRKVALALVAALGINTLAVTVGNVNGQVQIAHAQQTRLTDQNDINKLNSLKIKTLDTSVTSTKGKNGKEVAEVTFKNINVSDIQGVTTSNFKHAYFTERESIDREGSVNATATWDNNNKKLVVSGAEKPGIYSTTITIEYNDGKKEIYPFSLVKKAVDKLEIAINDIDVTPQAIVLKNIKFNGQLLKQGNKVSIREAGSKDPIATVEYDTKNNRAVFNKGISFEKGKVYEVSYKFGKGSEHEAVTQLVLVKQENPVVTPFAANGKDKNQATNVFTDEFKNIVQKDFVTGTVTSEQTQKTQLGASSEYSDVVYNWKVDGESVFSTVQTVRIPSNGSNAGKTYPAGALVNLTYDFDEQKNQDKINVAIKEAYISKHSFGNSNHSDSHHIPHAGVNIYYDKNKDKNIEITEKDSKLVGEYKVTIGSESKTYFDPTINMGPTAVTFSGQSTIGLGLTDDAQGIWLNQSTFVVPGNGDIKKNYDYYEDFEHGYTNIPVTFSVENTDKIKGESFSDIKNRLGLTEEITTIEENVPGNTVKTSIIVVKDDTQAVAVNANFVKTSESTGELTLTDAKDLVKNIDTNTVASKLKVDGASVALIADNTNDLKFQVTFNGQVPSSINWSFNVDNKNLVDTTAVLGGKLLTSQGTYETVNLVGGVTATNENTTAITSQFDLIAKFGESVPSNATVGLEDTDRLRVSYDELGRNNGKAIKGKVGTGKYQGVYQAGIWVEQQPFMVQLTKVDTSLDSATLTIDANFFNDKDIMSKVTNGRIEYRKVGDSNWTDSKVEIKKEDIKEEAITKTVTGLVSGAEYEFRVIYNYLDGKDTKNIESNIIKEKTKSQDIQLTNKGVTTNSVTLGVDPNFDLKEASKAVVYYKKTGTNDWMSNREFTAEELKKDPVDITINGLESNTRYDFKVVYYKDADKKQEIASKVIEGISTNAVSGNVGGGTISGGSGSSSSTTGSSIGSTTINTSTSNTVEGNTDVLVTLPSGVRYDNGRTPMPVNFKYKGKDGKVVTEKRDEYSNVKASFDGDKIKVEGLVPGKDYTELYIDYTDNNGKTRTLILKNVRVDSNVDSENYLSNVYMVVFNRPADENGYHFHLGNLKGKKVSVREFLLNMLTEKEFVETYTTTESKIEALYSGIVARESDEQGKAFWVNEYKKMLSVYGSESATLKAIADRMVHENELKELADKMGFLY